MSLALLILCLTTTGSVVARSAELELSAPESVAKILERSNLVREEGYQALNKAFNLLDRTFSFIERQTGVPVDGPEISEVLDSVMERLDRIEAAISEDRQARATEMKIMANNFTQKLENLEKKVDAKLSQLESLVGTAGEKVEALEVTVNNITSRIETKIDTSVNLSAKSVQLGTTIQTRQKAWLSEVRLISLYKLTGENNPHSARDYNPGLVVDGQFVFSNTHESYMRTYSHTRSSAANNKIWVELGGLFRVYCVRVWNTRDGNKSRFAGTQIYVDNTMIGTASGDWGFHDFCLAEEKVVHGSRVTLHQPRADYLILLEVQVWGNGPYNSSDIFN